MKKRYSYIKYHFQEILRYIYSQQLSFHQGTIERVEGVYMRYMTDEERDRNAAENSSAKGGHFKMTRLFNKPRVIWHVNIKMTCQVNLCNLKEVHV